MTAPGLLTIIKKAWCILSAQERRRWFLIAAFAIVASMLEVVTAIVIIGVVQSLTNPTQAEALFTRFELFPGLEIAQYMTILLLTFGGIFLFKNGFAAFETLWQNFTIQKINRSLKDRMLRRYSQAGYSFYQTKTSSHLLGIISGDIDMMTSSGLVALAIIISESCVLVSLSLTVVAINPQATLTILGISVVLAALFFKFLLPRFYKWGKEGQQATMDSYQALIEFFQGYKEILLYGQREKFLTRFDSISARRARSTARHLAAGSMPRIGIETVFVCIFIVTVLMLIRGGMESQQIAALMGAYIYAGFRMMPGLNRIIVQSGIIKLVAPNIERVYAEQQQLPAVSSIENIPGFTFDKSLVFDHVSFGYEGTGRHAVSDVSFEIKKGEIIGITGETGSGKSTLMDLILGLHPPSGGTIAVDGRYPVSCQQWHAMIGYVPQSIYLFDGTLRENILFGVAADDIAHVDLDRVIDSAQLRKLIDKLPSGLDTQIGERGVRLSGGERQRVAIARALCRQPSVLIFDEATSALDTETEARLVETINNIVEDRTVIMIAHRLTTLQNCDRIYVLSNSRIERVTSYGDLGRVVSSVN